MQNQEIASNSLKISHKLERNIFIHKEQGRKSNKNSRSQNQNKNKKKLVRNLGK